MPDAPSDKPHSGPPHDRLAQIEPRLRLQSALIRAQAAMIAEDRALLDGVSEAARIGIWECSLPDERLRWTDGVYDLFDLPRASAVERRTALELYEQGSREALDAIRRKTITEGKGFHLDAEIVTPLGRRRWIRITASVERVAGIPARIFGMKQDVTEDKLLLERALRLAETDSMTGLASRGRFEAWLRQPLGALMLIDLDGFKRINDTYGHAAGDACLKVAAERLARLVGESDRVARIGGDEFAIVLETWPDAHAIRAAAAQLASRVVESLRAPIRWNGLSLGVGASVGIALAESTAPGDLFAAADAALYAAKAAGRNTFRWFEPGSRLRTPG